MQDIDRYVDEHAADYVAMLQRMVRQPSVAAQRVGMAETARVGRGAARGVGAAPQQYDTRGGFPGRLRASCPARSSEDAQLLQPLRRPAGRAARPLGARSLGLRGAGRPALGPRRGRQQGQPRRPDRRGRRLPPGAGRAAAARQVHRRGRGGDRLAPPGHFTEDHPDLCRADGCIWEFGGVDLEGRPLIHLGLKGMCYVELRGAGRGGRPALSVATIVPNAAWRLVWALTRSRGRTSGSASPASTTGCRPPTDAERAALERMPDTEAQQLEKSASTGSCSA